MATIKQLKKLGFEGTDASLEISLFEYRLAFRPTGTDANAFDRKEMEYQFLYTNDGKNFDTGFFTPKSFASLLRESWFELDKLCSYADTNEAELLRSFPYSMYEVISYYGTENIFGSSYGSFTLKEFKPTKW